MSQNSENPLRDRRGEWYAIHREQQRVLGPFRSEEECTEALGGTLDRRRWDVVPLIVTH